MPNYTVTIPHQIIDVEADSEDDAVENALMEADATAELDQDDDDEEDDDDDDDGNDGGGGSGQPKEIHATA